VTTPDKEYRIEIQPNQFSVRAYEKSRGDMSYVVSATIQTYGCVGWMRQISNPLFFDLLLPRLGDMLKQTGVDSLEGPMNPAMARALRMKARGLAKVTIMKTCECAGRNMPWVKVERLDAPDEVA
jgi:hypothetical protein